MAYIHYFTHMDKTRLRQQLGECGNTSETMEFPNKMYSTFNLAALTKMK